MLRIECSFENKIGLLCSCFLYALFSRIQQVNSPYALLWASFLLKYSAPNSFLINGGGRNGHCYNAPVRISCRIVGSIKKCFSKHLFCIQLQFQENINLPHCTFEICKLIRLKTFRVYAPGLGNTIVEFSYPLT